MSDAHQARWRELTQLLDLVDRKGIKALKSTQQIRRLCQLYRQVTIDLARARGAGDDPTLVQYLNLLAARAHGQVYASRPVNLRGLVDFVAGGFPRQLRRYAVPVLAASAVFLLTSLASFAAVVRQPELAYSLFNEQVVEYENLRLQKQHGEYKGNFTFRLSQSPLVAVAIIFNNVRVVCTMFALGALLCLPGVLLLIYNGRMLGTLAGLTWNYNYFGDFNSLILTHGVLELSAICIAGGAGLMVGWSLIAPGALTRREALRRSAREAFGLLGGACLMLVVAGIIEAYVTPHFAQPVRWSVAITSAVLLALYVTLAGRKTGEQTPRWGTVS
jgi:uncharacterized membrane protein SpoIIM required for sporulation